MSNDKNTKSFMQFNQLSFRCYLPHEIKKISVVELNQTKTFDEAAFPIKGGLYDAAFGPTSVYLICETCGLKFEHCPGHFGHIQLSVPVFNPLFFSFTFNIMKGTCIHCHRFTCNTGNDAIVAFLKQWSELPSDLVKNNVGIKNAMMKEFLRENLFKRRTRCPHCKRSNGILRNDAGRALILDFSASQNALRKKDKSSNLVRRTAGVFSSDYILEIEDDAADEIDLKNDNKNFLSTKFSDENSVLDPLALSEKFLSQQLNHVVTGKCDKLIWRAAEVREHFRLLWRKEGAILQYFFPLFESEGEEEGDVNPMDILFCQTILVQPSKFRPQRFLHDDSFEHPITANYRRVMEADQLLTVVKIVMTSKKSTVEAKNLINNKVIGKTLNEKLHNAYLDLQVRINCLYDQNADKNNLQQHPGLKQIIEKKQGIFRMNMMGKRVNYACRSVITPDPYLDVDEIGIPDLFARRLTFSEPTNFLNVAKLREMVRNGPLQHPGANFVQFKGTYKQILPSGNNNVRQRIALGKRLTTGTTKANDATTLSYVFRHLEKGDHLLMNRQPSLHKPSIMGHRARILKGQRALRMNYAPCKAYNADFDGDEMNGHFLQNRVAQSEASELANVASNYLVPKDGTPILGLIQDHVVSGVLLTMRGRFLSKTLFMQLVFSAFAETTKRIIIPPPAMFKPEMLWTGKQVVTTIVKNLIPDGMPKINLSAKAKTALSCWKVPGVDAQLKFDMSESQVIFRDGELLCGVLDKEHYGATQFGLIHCCYELYGPKIAAKVLSCFSRLFTTYLQHHGFTLGVADILVTKEADKVRRKTVRELRKVGPAVVQKTFNLTENATLQEIKHVLATAYNNPRKDRSDVSQLDFTTKQVMAKLCEQINNACVPRGMIRCFPDNALQMMIQCGAKGSMVNSIQISCALGQIELEGQRPPLSAIGRTLPSFRSFDPSPRAGGFIDQRFLTGINPQELFFHTMAGREGLVDTAVKTSRSGYLQRCIIKHLEGISVRYDQTVRDHDGSIVQFRYGEDGMDVGKATFINPKLFKFLEDNAEAVRKSAVPDTAFYADWNTRQTEKYFKRLSKWKKNRLASKTTKDTSKSCKVFESEFLNFCSRENNVGKSKSKLIKEWRNVSKEDRQLFGESKTYVDSIDVKFNPVTNLGALPEKMLEEIINYVRTNDSSTDFRHIMFWKGLRAYADPGENVGLLAAQSIGEPSTQMTLNTFHFAGRGEMNVTLGIPRLREILMTSGKNILTPMTEVAIRDNVTEDKIEKIKLDLNPVALKKVLKKFILEEQVEQNSDGRLWRCYVLTIELLRSKNREMSVRHVTRKQIIRELERRFTKEVAVSIGKRVRDILEHQQIQHKRLRVAANFSKRETNKNEDDGEEEKNTVPKKSRAAESSDDDDTDDSNAADAEEARLKKRHQDDGAEYEGEEEEEDEVNDKEPAENADDFKTLDDDDVMNESNAFEDNEINVDMSQCGKRRKSLIKNATNGGGESSSWEDVAKVAAKASKENMDTIRVSDVLNAHPLIVDYKYDCHSDRWCSVKYQLPLKNKIKLDIMAIIENVINKFVVVQVPGIEKAIVREEQRNSKTIKILQIQGSNMEALYSRSDMLDANTLYSNDINFMLNKYGIEACGRTIAREMNNVFSVYGIEVNPRHLSLTADYMTFTGEVHPFSRGAMTSNASPLQKMTFETTGVFLRDTIITGQNDNLSSPSARLVTGQLHRSGTGGFELLEEPAYIHLYSANKPKKRCA